MKDVWEIGAKAFCFITGHEWHWENPFWRCENCGEVRERKP